MFQEELDASNYKEIGDAFVVDKTGKSRLFVTQGRKDGLTPKRLLTFLGDKCNIPPKKIWDIQIMETFAFVSLPFQDAERVLAMFNKGKGAELAFTKAKARPSAPAPRR
jgi:ATP-dependent RNA helicase DeaD